MKRRIVSLLLALIVLALPVLATTSCNFGGGDTTTTPAETTPATTTPAETTEGDNNGEETPVVGKEVSLGDEPIHIVFYHTMGESLRAVLDKYIVEFNKIYPNITIEHKQVGGYDDVRNQITTEITVGDQPNIAYCYPDHVALYNVAKAVQTLDQYIDSIDYITLSDGTQETIGLTKKQIGNFIDGYYEEGRAFGDGKMYTLPMSKSTEVFYYNKTFFEQNGLTPPTTWDELEALCARILEIDPNCIPLGYDSEANLFITLCEQYGSPYTSATPGNNFLFDNDTNKEFMAMFRTWFQDKLMTTQTLNGGAYTSAMFTGEGSDGTAVSTRCYMCIGSTGGATYQQPAATTNNETGETEYEFEVGIVPIPQANKDNQKVILQGPSVCIFKKADPQQVLASWLFAKHLTTDKVFQGSISMNNGYCPVIKSVDSLPAYAEFLADASTENIQALAINATRLQQDYFYSSPAFYGSSDARLQVETLVTECLSVELGGKTVKEKFDEIFAAKVRACKTAIGQK